MTLQKQIDNLNKELKIILEKIEDLEKESLKQLSTFTGAMLKLKESINTTQKRLIEKTDSDNRLYDALGKRIKKDHEWHNAVFDLLVNKFNLKK